MAVFAVLSEKPNSQLGKTVQDHYPDSFYQLSSSQWLVIAEATSKEVANKLDIREGKFDRAVVFAMTGTYSGYHASSLWEWLGQKIGKSL